MKAFFIFFFLALSGCAKFVAMGVESASPEEIKQYSDRELCGVKTRFPQHFTLVAAEELKTRDVGTCSIYYLGCKELGYTPQTPEFKDCEVALWNKSAPLGSGGGVGIELPNAPAITSCYKGDNSIHCVESNGGVGRRYDY